MSKLDMKTVEWNVGGVVVNRPEKTPLQEWLPAYIQRRQAMGVKIGWPK